MGLKNTTILAIVVKLMPSRHATGMVYPKLMPTELVLVPALENATKAHRRAAVGAEACHVCSYNAAVTLVAEL